MDRVHPPTNVEELGRVGELVRASVHHARLTPHARPRPQLACATGQTPLTRYNNTNRDITTSPEITQHHQRSHNITRDLIISPEISQHQQRPHNITRDLIISPEISQHHQRSHNITRDVTRSMPSAQNTTEIMHKTAALSRPHTRSPYAPLQSTRDLTR